MNLINLNIKHKALGSGIVLEFDGKQLSVQFDAKISKFVYPDAFENFIQAEDPAVQNSIQKEIEFLKQSEDNRRLAELSVSEKMETAPAGNLTLQKGTSQKNPYAPSASFHPQRSEGKRLTFFVFQGTTFDKEFRGGYIWAPISTKSGLTPHHWTRLLDIRKGDILLHGCNGYVKAISIAKGTCFNCLQPTELETEDLWEDEGRRVDCDYTSIQNPIKTSAFTQNIIHLSQSKYAPFDRNGKGNMGYLFEINQELAKIFVESSIRQNPYLTSLGYIHELLQENGEDSFL